MFLCNVSCEIFLYEQVNSAVYYIYSHRPACSDTGMPTYVMHVHVGLQVVVVVECQPLTKRLH